MAAPTPPPLDLIVTCACGKQLRLTDRRLAHRCRCRNCARMVPDGNGIVRQYWDEHAVYVFALVTKGLERELLIDLPSSEVGVLIDAFRLWSKDRIAADPKFQARYEAADAALLDEFVRYYTSGR